VSEFDIAEEFITACPPGLWERHANPGDEVEAGSVVGSFSDVATGTELGRVVASRSARILNPVVSWPQVGPGQWLMASGTLVAEHDPRAAETAGA
jgi:predicted deacylase